MRTHNHPRGAAAAGLWVLAMARLVAGCRESKPSVAVEDKPERVQATPTWSVDIPAHFTRSDNGDSWQAFDDHRVVYVSSLRVGEGNGPATEAADIDAIGARVLGEDPADPRLEQSSGPVQGKAVVRSKDRGVELKGYMVAEGRIAVCVIDVDDRRFEPWAMGVWRSLRTSSGTP